MMNDRFTQFTGAWLTGAWLTGAWRGAVLLLIVTMLASVGCSDQNQAPTTGSRTPPNVPQPPMPPMMKPANPTPPVAKKQEPQQKERVKAQVGVGKKGRGLESPGIAKPIVTPARVYFRTRERIVFEIQIPHALQLYKAVNSHAPRSQEEFMREIIKKNYIKLPELRAGERYVYDPKTEQLMVERPARNSQ